MQIHQPRRHDPAIRYLIDPELAPRLHLTPNLRLRSGGQNALIPNQERSRAVKRPAGIDDSTRPHENRPALVIRTLGCTAR